MKSPASGKSGKAVDPNKSFYSDDEEDEDASKADAAAAAAKAAQKERQEKAKEMDADHKLLLKSAALLVHSSNSGVIVGVANLFFHLAPQTELLKVAGALVRLVRSRREISYVVLSTIATLASSRPVTNRRVKALLLSLPLALFELLFVRGVG